MVCVTSLDSTPKVDISRSTRQLRTERTVGLKFAVAHALHDLVDAHELKRLGLAVGRLELDARLEENVVRVSVVVDGGGGRRQRDGTIQRKQARAARSTRSQHTHSTSG